ncbi:MAG: hypothetical protein HYR85_10490 [Planctomycetes bacterium]|nr:hypothetical protein [Planctomycetota bacterium]MBI3845103.1 hypothetical protein [Planctomycetota bacterium]
MPDVTFQEVLLQQVKKTPWFLSSIVLHLVVIVVASFVTGAQRIVPVSDEGVRIGMTHDAVEPVVPFELPQIPDEPSPLVVVDDPAIGPDDRGDPSIDEPTGIADSDATGGGTGGKPGDAGNGDSPDPAAAFNGKGGGNDIIGVGLGSYGSGGGDGGGMKGRIGGPGRAPGHERADQAANWGLDWLARHQSEDGSWDADGFMVNCQLNQCSGKGGALYDPGVSGLALLAFLGAGYTDNSGRYRDTVKKGLRYLVRIQDPEGCFGGRTAPNFTYGHAICTLAMAEAWGLTGNTLFKGPAQKGVDFVGQCKNPYKAWRYGVHPGENDMSVTGWMVMALKSARMAGLEVNPNDLHDALNFIDEVTDSYGKTGYTAQGNGPVRTAAKQEEYPSENSEAMTAAAVLCRILLGEDPAKSDKVKKGIGLMAKRLPTWEKPKLDFYYWYYGTLAMFQAGGREWIEWNKAMQTAIVDKVRRDGDEAGSWDPDDCWGEEGGRVYSTALLTMCLEVYYRYDRVFGTDANRKPNERRNEKK